MKRNIFLYTVLGLMLFLLPHSTKAVELITNGGFETGDFTGWTRTNGPNPYEIWRVSTTGMGIVDSPLPTATVVTQGSFNAWQGVACDAGSFLMYQDVTIPSGNRVQFKWSDRYQMNLTSYCSGAGCGTVQYAVEILNTSNVLLQTVYLVTTPPSSNTNTGWVNHFANLSAYQGNTIRIRFRTTATAVTRQGPGRLEVDAVSVNAFVPTAANVEVGGRVLTNEGAGISRTNVTLTDGAGVTRSATTNNFGYYNFDSVAVGETYIITVNNKKYLFTNSPRVLNIQENLTDVDFIASP